MDRTIWEFGNRKTDMPSLSVQTGSSSAANGSDGSVRKVCIRIRNNMYVSDSRGHDKTGFRLFRDSEIGQSRIPGGGRKCGGVRGRISGAGLPGGELLIIACSDSPGAALETYAKRRRIVTMSACPESRGFGFEAVHPGDSERISRLPAVICIAFVRAYLIGDRLREVRPVAVRKHGYRSQSVFRYGFDHLRKIFSDVADHPDGFITVIQVSEKPSRIIFVR